MKMLQFLFCAGLLVLSDAEVLAQGQHRVMMNVNYSVNVPAGNFGEYLGKTSFRGWTANVTYRINEKVALGAATGFQDYYEKTDRQIYKDVEGNDISAVVTKSIQTIPLLATLHYSLKTQERFRPYVGLGIGANLIMHHRYLGQFGNENNKVGLAARPEIGLFLPLRQGSESGLNIAGAFNFMPYDEEGLKNVNSWGINLGAKFPLR